MLKIIPIADVRILSDRTRQEITPAALEELKEDIRKIGLLHPIVCYEKETPKGARYVLVAGERRTKAIAALDEEGHALRYGMDTIPAGHIPATIIAREDATQLLEVEISENLKRVDLTWQERISALARLHELRTGQNAAHTIQATALEVAGPAGLKEDTTRRHVSRALLIAKSLDDPRVAAAKTEKEAWTYLQQKMTANFQNKLLEVQNEEQTSLRITTDGGDISLGFGGSYVSSSPHSLFLGRFQDVDLPRGSFSCIVADPPYGIRADKLTRQKTARHFYVDDEETARETAFEILLRGMDWLDSDGALFMFCTPNLWHELYSKADEVGYSVWHRPLIWQKSREGLAPWGNKGFRYTYEMLLFAVKGQRGLLRTELDILDFPRSQRGKLHGAQKPVRLIRHLLSICTFPGEAVLDPCCGSGTIFPAASAVGCIATGVELDPHYHAIAQLRMTETLENESDTDLSNNGQASDDGYPELNLGAAPDI